MNAFCSLSDHAVQPCRSDAPTREREHRTAAGSSDGDGVAEAAKSQKKAPVQKKPVTKTSKGKKSTESSSTGTRTLVFRVRAEYPNQLDYREGVGDRGAGRAAQVQAAMVAARVTQAA